MEKELIVGLIYSRFDEKVGPNAVAWIPNNLSNKVKNLISLKSFNILAGEKGVSSKSLAILPFPSQNLKGLIGTLEIRDTSQRGGVNDASLTLLFNEADDLIFYKYLKNFEAVFKEAIDNIKKLEESKASSELIMKELNKFYKKNVEILKELRNEEISSQEKDAFFRNGYEQTEGKGYRFKIILCGDAAVGKTSIVLRFTDKAFRRTYIPTLGVNISEKRIHYKKILVDFIVWDIAGQSKFSRMRKHFYTGADGQILVFDLTKSLSLENVYDWYNDVKKYVKTDLQGIILGNKSDLPDLRTVKEEEIIKISKELNLKYIETSALSGENIDESFYEIGKILINHREE